MRSTVLFRGNVCLVDHQPVDLGSTQGQQLGKVQALGARQQFGMIQ